MKRLTLVFCALIAAGCSQQPPASPSEPAAAAPGATEARTDPSLGHGGRPIGTRLSGATEVPGPGDPDGDGFARLTLNRGQQELCFWLSALHIEPATAVHIHKAPAGSAGPVVVGLTPPTDGLSTGCLSVSRALIDDIIRNPDQYYVNVHNVPYPAGAIRGQLKK